MEEIQMLKEDLLRTKKKQCTCGWTKSDELMKSEIDKLALGMDIWDYGETKQWDRRSKGGNV